MGDPEAVEAATLVGKWLAVSMASLSGWSSYRTEDLPYAVLSGDRAQTIRMTHRIDADQIITDQPSAPDSGSKIATT